MQLLRREINLLCPLTGTQTRQLRKNDFVTTNLPPILKKINAYPQGPRIFSESAKERRLFLLLS